MRNAIDSGERSRCCRGRSARSSTNQSCALSIELVTVFPSSVITATPHPTTSQSTTVDVTGHGHTEPFSHDLATPSGSEWSRTAQGDNCAIKISVFFVQYGWVFSCGMLCNIFSISIFGFNIFYFGYIHVI